MKFWRHIVTGLHKLKANIWPRTVPADDFKGLACYFFRRKGIFRGGNGMRQLLIYLVLAALLLAGLGIWQIFRDTGQGALLVQKYTDINDLPSNYKDLVKAAAKALPDIGPDADFGFAASPEEVMPRGKHG